jgi:hypothetical protein
MIVPGGGITPDGTQCPASRPTFLLPVHVVGTLLRQLFLTCLLALSDVDKLSFFSTLAGVYELDALV